MDEENLHAINEIAHPNNDQRVYILGYFYEKMALHQ